MRPLRTPLLFLCCALAKAGPTPGRDQPGPVSDNILDYVDSFPYDTGDKCSAVITTGGAERYLAFPNAKIVHQSVATIDCQTRLRLSTSQMSGYRFSVNWASLSGYLHLEPGAYIERMNVSLSYSRGGNQVDVATARYLYGKQGTGYDGLFNLSLPVTPGGSDGTLGTTGCQSSTTRTTVITVYVFVSLAHEMIQVDDYTPHYGTLGGDSPDSQLKIGLDATSEKC